MIETLPGELSAVDLVVKLLCHDVLSVSVIQMSQVN